jgi:class 3 adenylate cyclase/tetratricopeptide (TPR) repeat protein
VRKTVTVVFCDVVGSTELGERLDPEVLRAVMSRFYAAVRGPVRRYGGTVEKVIGDAVVAVFGTPVVHEDDALRAVRAALEMSEAVRELGDVQARIGVNTGDVLARDATLGESLVVGDAVNIAARLEQAAAPGTVLVGEATWSLVAHAARGEPVPPVLAKGKREPLVAWRLDGVDPRAGGHRRRLDLPMVARETEIALLRLAAQRTEQLGRPHLVTVLGQPGIGKSRLVAQLGDELTVVTGHCRDSASPGPMEPLTEALRGAFRGGSGTEDGVAALMAGDADAAAVAACLAPGALASVPDVAWAAARLIGAMANAGPVVIALEDVHWADDALLDVVEQLVEAPRRRSLLVICTARPEFGERRPGWGTGTNAISVGLERLDDEQTRLLLLSASPGLPPEQAERVIASAEGNPLFAEHLAALVTDHDPGAGLPRSIQVLLSARLEALPASEQEVMSVAAVAGRDFPLAAVEALVGRPIAADIDRLAQRELIEPTAPGRHQFGHALLQEAAYELIPKGRRSELHARLARRLDDDGAGDAAVGDHLERAVLLRAELGPMDDATAEMRTEAGMRLAAAGRRMDSMGDPGGARALLERALRLLPERSPRRAEAMVAFVSAGWNVVPSSETSVLLNAAAAFAAELGMRALELRARLMRQTDDEHYVRVENGYSDEIESALTELEELDDPRALATALCARADLACSTGRAADAVGSALRALELVRAADEDTVWALAILIWAITESPMPVGDAEALLGRLLAELGMRPAVRSELMLGQARLVLLAGRTAEAFGLLDDAREIERDLGRIHAWRVTENQALMLLYAGRFDEARDVLLLAVERMDLRNGRWESTILRTRLASAEVRLGNLAEAGALATAVLEPVPSTGYESQARALTVLSEVQLAEGDVRAAVDLARQSVAVASGGDWALLTAEAQMALARALGRAESLEEARAVAAEALRLYERKGYVAGRAAAETLLRSLG